MLVAVFNAMGHDLIRIMTHYRSWEWVSLSVLIAGGLLARASGPRSLHLSDLLLLVVVVLTIDSALLHAQSLLNFRTWVVAGLLWVVWAGWWLSRVQGPWNWRWLALAGLLLFTIWLSCLMKIFITSITFDYGFALEDFAGFTVHPRHLGVPFALFLPVLWVAWRIGREQGGRLVERAAALVLILVFAMIILSGGRAALLATLVGLVLASLVLYQQKGLVRQAWGSYLFVAIAGGLLYYVAAHLLFHDYFSGRTGTGFAGKDVLGSSGRLRLWSYGWEQFLRSDIWFGRGFYGFECRKNVEGTLHNIYFQTLLEFGIVGLAVLLTVMLWAAYLLWQTARARPDHYSFALLWMAGALGLFSMVEWGYAFPTGQWATLWFIILALARAREVGVITDPVVLQRALPMWLVLPLGLLLLAGLLYAMTLSWQEAEAYARHAVTTQYSFYFRPRLWIDDCGSAY